MQQRLYSALLAFVLIVSPILAGSALAQASAKTKKSSAHGTRAKSRKHKKQLTPAQRRKLQLRARRAKRAFVASADLKPMAQQLLDLHSQAAYNGVERWARKHPNTDAASLACLVMGYVHYTDHEFQQAISALKNAKLHSGELDDYVDYFLASSYMAGGNQPKAMPILKEFGAKHPDSPFADDVALLYASMLTSNAKPAQAVAVLTPYADSGHADIQVALGRAYIKLGDTEHGVRILRKLYYGSPAAPEADDARAILQSLPATALPTATYTERRQRADLLMSAHRYQDALAEYRSLLSDATPERVPELQVSTAVALYKSGSKVEAKQILDTLPDEPSEVAAQRDYYLLDIARDGNDDTRMQALLQHMRQIAPTSHWLQDALLNVANMYLLRKDYASAAAEYGEIYQRFPNGRLAPYTHWKTAWLTLRLGRKDDAKHLFEEQVASYPASGEVAPALYWRGRLAEEDNDLPRARAYYLKLGDRFRNYYYAVLARERLDKIGAGGDVLQNASLENIPDPPTPEITGVDPPADNLRVQRSNLLQNGALYDFAVKELQMAASEGDNPWAAREIARIYQDGGHYDRALEAVKRAVPAYFALDLNELPRPYWETLFPRPYWAEVKRYATANNLDPFLVASLIRQESEFNPGAISNANAWGLMQVLPSTGKMLARELRIRHFNSSQLLTPSTNVQLGTRYFKSLVNHFGGKVEYALAAYNAGTDRVEDWMNSGKYRDTAEFVESIPFTETREYVQAIMRNATVYRQLYGDTAQQEAVASSR
jgi:soluble lytic murein transglycosylase